MGRALRHDRPRRDDLRWLRGRPFAPAGALWEAALVDWSGLASDAGARFDHEMEFDLGVVAPQVTWGNSLDMVAAVDGRVPDPAGEADAARRAAMETSLTYMGLDPGRALADLKVDRVFIGSCTNSRIGDLRSAAALVRGRQVAAHTRAWVVPGSENVKRQAETEGLAEVFRAAGFEWRTPGCSMCLGGNGDLIAPGERAVSTANRNFAGRQGRAAVPTSPAPKSPPASAIAGRIADPRELRGAVA